jgi:hypothetical protein
MYISREEGTRLVANSFEREVMYPKAAGRSQMLIDIATDT